MFGCWFDFGFGWVGFVLGVFCLGIVLGLGLNLWVFKIELVGLVVWVVVFWVLGVF